MHCLLSAHQLDPLQFEHAISQLIHHPEYNSMLILWSKAIQVSVVGLPDLMPALQDLQPIWNIHCKLLPHCPTCNTAIEQHCMLYVPSISHMTDAESLHLTVLMLIPLLLLDGVLPYYHPTVMHLAFHFILITTLPSIKVAVAVLYIKVIPLPRTLLDPTACKTCFCLLGHLNSMSMAWTLSHSSLMWSCSP